jgi:hypothetical protein
MPRGKYGLVFEPRANFRSFQIRAVTCNICNMYREYLLVCLERKFFFFTTEDFLPQRQIENCRWLLVGRVGDISFIFISTRPRHRHRHRHLVLVSIPN